MSGCEYYINKDAEVINDLVKKYKGVLDNDDIIQYHRSLPGYLPTPLYSLPGLASSIGIRQLWVKDESERMGLKAFKVLGASYAMKKLVKDSNEDTTFCTATDGNHGRALAWSAAMLGKKAVVFVPDDTVEPRIRSIEKEGAKVIVVKGNYDDAVKMAKDRAEAKGWVLVQDSSWEGYIEIPVDIMAGYTTILKEMEDEINTPGEPAFDIVILKAGVGTWAAAAVWYYHERYRESRPKIILVEPSSADCCMESIKQGRITSITKSQDTIMAGLNCGTPSLIAMDILKKGVDLFISITDYYAKVAMVELFSPLGNDEQIISGESGAAGLGGLIALKKEPSLKEAAEFIGLNNNSRVLIFNTEGNTDPVNFHSIIHGD